MPRSPKHVTRSQGDIGVSSQASPLQQSAGSGHSRLDQLAALVAGGEIPFPDQLPAGELTYLARQVGSIRRGRLVRFIAHAIAADIHESVAAEETEHDST